MYDDCSISMWLGCCTCGITCRARFCLFFHVRLARRHVLERLVTWIQISASLDHPKVKKAEPRRLNSWKLTANIEVLLVYSLSSNFCDLAAEVQRSLKSY